MCTIVTVSRLIKVHIPIGVAGEREIFYLYTVNNPVGVLIQLFYYSNEEIKEADV